ncbi:hypothetical protein GN956_G5711 [Arapaima gigas]
MEESRHTSSVDLSALDGGSGEEKSRTEALGRMPAVVTVLTAMRVLEPALICLAHLTASYRLLQVYISFSRGVKRTDTPPSHRLCELFHI